MDRKNLKGGCYVLSAEGGDMHDRDGLQWTRLIGADTGAEFISEFFFRLDAEASPVIGFGERDIVMFVIDGEGEIEICGKVFALKSDTGVYVRPGEAFRLTRRDQTPLRLVVGVCPQALEPEWLDTMPDHFDDRHPERLVEVDKAKREAMGDRFFQVLVDNKVGSDQVTQFLGEIPKSKAKSHYHLYEEAICILKGEGYMWTEDEKAPVRAGDIIFLPRKQEHSLECTADDGMQVLGLFYPAGSPAENY